MKTFQQHLQEADFQIPPPPRPRQPSNDQDFWNVNLMSSQTGIQLRKKAKNALQELTDALRIAGSNGHVSPVTIALLQEIIEKIKSNKELS
jgi:hypothetical protein